MVKVTGVCLPIGFGEADLKNKIAARLGVAVSSVQRVILLKKAVDARNKANVHYVVNAAADVSGNEDKLAARLAGEGVSLYRDETPFFVASSPKRGSPRPVVAGFGPAGMFAALALAKAGRAPIVLERGLPAEERVTAVEAFWSGGDFSEAASVQFGEGGAGTFSDGKLTTGIRDERCRLVLAELKRHGAPEEILYEAKPHIGTDRLVEVVRNVRRSIIELGGEVRFRTRLTGFTEKNGRLAAVRAETPAGEEEIGTDTLILAIGHSARDTFEALYRAGLVMTQKDFSVGVRIEHLQADISRAQYGARWKDLPPADYKLAAHLASGRSVYTFCMCPGGTVVNGCSEEGGVAVNGMSRYRRDGVNANAALLVGVSGADFASDHPLAGLQFQRKWERAACRAGGGAYRAPAQRVADFLAGRETKSFGSVTPTYRPGVTGADLASCLPGYVTESLKAAIPLFDRKLRGFSAGDAVITGVETRSSSPVRILRDERFQALAGIYPCGEGAGYAGGIMSAAADGLRVAEAALGGPIIEWDK